MPTLVQLVHGYPPREVAGTELYAARLTQALHRRGWTVHVVAATRAPGRDHGSVLEEEHPHGSVLRLVNNLPWRPLGHAEKDGLIEGRVRQALARLRPDVVHVQHLLFLSAHLRLHGAVCTLHDAWAWCPRGGNLLQGGVSPCPGPSAARCVPCYGDWARGYAVEHALGRLAGGASRVVAPETLHKAWRRLPAKLRGLTRRGAPPKDTVADFEQRQQAVHAAFARMRLLSPSAWLADRAAEQGLSAALLPHGVEAAQRWRGGGPLVFIGSLAPHKGAHLAKAVGARIYGPAVEAAYASTLGHHGALDPEAVPGVLAGAEAQVMGSLWPENAPLIVLEARAAGCPVIAPRIGGLPELVHEGVDGFLYEAGDEDDLRAAVARLRAAGPLSPRPPQTFEQHVDRLLEHYGAVGA